ncbi:DUF3617 family protein [Henriciella sp. AS95]|uniref:DUF3617 domain-containing protein n=1 Tax=Henriciella sp. AS95 TaxID=3135782 RepID=UPI00317295F4
MKIICACIAVSVLAPVAAQAEESVSPGLWSYEARAAMGPIPMNDAGTHCVDPAFADSSFEAMLNDINPDCQVADGAYEGAGYRFTLQCTGAPTGELKGLLSMSGDTAQLNATGWTGTAESQVPVIVSASAKKLSPTCS